jgi:hypothetical protein
MHHGDFLPEFGTPEKFNEHMPEMRSCNFAGVAFLL